MDSDERARFIRANTTIAAPPLVPEIRLHLATEVTPLWQATEAMLEKSQLPPPYWAFAWPGGQALARHVLDHPELARGRSVLDIGAGSGLVAIAASRCGGRVAAADPDAFAACAIALNAALNGVTLDIVTQELIGVPGPEWQTVLAGDMCYERPLAERLIAWLRPMASRGAVVLLGDPGRAYLPKSGLAEIARHTVPTSLELEDKTSRETVIWRLEPG
jgi:predicted nicotinamide N-methyase